MKAGMSRARKLTERPGTVQCVLYVEKIANTLLEKYNLFSVAKWYSLRLILVHQHKKRGSFNGKV
jgi:actin-related protein